MKKKAKRNSKQSVSSKKINKSMNIERERVNYEFKNNTIQATFKNHSVTISAKQVQELIARRNDLKKFYSFCNADINLLAQLHADAQAKKQQECKNTQYDSRKKLMRLVLHIALTSMKQKSKATKKVKKAKAVVSSS